MMYVEEEERERERVLMSIGVTAFGSHSFLSKLPVKISIFNQHFLRDWN